MTGGHVMPQGNEKPSAVNAPADLPTLRNEQQCPKREILEGEALEDKVDARKRCQQELNGMPELKDDRVLFDDEVVCLNLGEPSPEVMEYARRELGETDEVKCQTLQELRDMIYERGECLPYRMDDDFLIRFLRARDFNVNRAHRLKWLRQTVKGDNSQFASYAEWHDKLNQLHNHAKANFAAVDTLGDQMIRAIIQKVVNYCNFKEDHPEIHKNVIPEEMKHIGDDDVMTVPAYKTQCGRRMMIYRMGNWNPRKYSVEEIFKATVIILELGILEPTAQILGGIAIFDLEGITMAHAWTVTPQVASMVVSLMVTAFPVRTHAIHILHQSWVFDLIFAVFKPLLDVRMQNRIFFHGNDMASFHKHISPNHLPKKYGGTREELPYHKWIESLGRVPEIVKQMRQLGYGISEKILKQVEQEVEK